MSDNDSDEPIGRRGSSHRKKSSSISKRKQTRTKAKRKIISSDEENMDEIKPPTKVMVDQHRNVEPVNVEKLLDIQRPSLAPLIGKTTLETTSFSPLLKGPPSPRHHSESLNWKHKVNLIGEKVVDPMIHICDKCQLPILIYARMIPCKHVFCLECGRAAEKICHKCGDKVTRVEQTTLGKVYMCNHQQGKTREPCKRTYLSQRDLQAHISHRHLKIKEKVVPAATPASVVTAPPAQPVISQVGTRDPRHLHSPAVIGHPRSASGSSVVPTLMGTPPKVVPFVPPPAPPLPPLQVPPITPPVPSAASYLNPPPVYPPHPGHPGHGPQLVPPPTAVYPGSQYSTIPATVHGSYVHPTTAYGQPPPPPPPTPYVPPPPPNSFDDYRGPQQNHWSQRPPQRDYRAPQGYYRQ